MSKWKNNCELRFVGTAPFSCEGVLTSLGLAFSPRAVVTVFPGFCDVHTHLREPGFSYKETISSGTLSAAAGGFTAVCTMPNLNPVPDSPAHLKIQTDLIRENALISVTPYGSITVGEKGEKLSDFAGMAKDVVAFSDDGRGVQSDEMMAEAMRRAKALGKMIVAHCEVNSLLRGGYIHAGAYAAQHGHKGISSESEYAQIRRDLRLVSQIECAYHVCHISTKESVALIREAKAAGLDVTCETAPHYLVLDESALREDGKFKMNPPLRGREDREALLEGVADGTIDMIATDHAPHSAEEKSKGLVGSAFGVVGLETAFPAIYTHLVKIGIISLERAVELFSTAPRKRFQIQADPGFCFWDLEREALVDPASFRTLGRATPFEGEIFFGVCLATVYQNKAVFRKGGAL